MVAPALLAAGFGLAGLAFGKKKSKAITAPAQDPRLTQALSGLYGIYNTQQNASNQFLTGMQQGYQDILQAPQFGQYEQNEYNIAQDISQSQLKNAQLNILNAGNQASSFTLGNALQQGINVNGATSAALQAGIRARGQSSLNDYANQQAQQLLGYRNTLLQNAYNRKLTGLSAATSMQAQLDSQAQAKLGSLVSVDDANRRMQLQIMNANQQAQQARQNGMLGLIGGVATTAIGAMSGNPFMALQGISGAAGGLSNMQASPNINFGSDNYNGTPGVWI